jgi:hypothetical protein
MATPHLNRLAIIAAMGGCMAVSLPAQADTFTATATVLNTITLTPTQDLTFGTLYAKSGGGSGDVETLTMTPGGIITYAGTGTTSKLISLGGQAPAIINISGMAASTTVNVVTDNPVNLSTGNPAVATFVLTVTDDTSAGTVTTDASGNATIKVGGTITTQDTANTYQNGVYTGSYDVTVSY